MDEGRKRVLAIVAGILVPRHLKTTEDLLVFLSEADKHEARESMEKLIRSLMLYPVELRGQPISL